MTDIEKYTTKEFWKDAPEGTTHCVLGNNTCAECWVKEIAGEFFYSYGSGNWKPWDNGHTFKDIMIPKPKFDELWMPEIGTECEVLWNSGGVPIYKLARILAKTTESEIVFEWIERKGDVGVSPQNTDSYGCPRFRPIQEVKEPETVPKWKFDALVKELEFYQKKLNESQHLENKIKMFVDKDVWFWEDDGENHLESLACPIVIDADTLRKLIKTGG